MLVFSELIHVLKGQVKSGLHILTACFRNGEAAARLQNTLRTFTCMGKNYGHFQTCETAEGKFWGNILAQAQSILVCFYNICKASPVLL